MTDSTEGRPTTASIDRRVERLEVAQAETVRKVDLLTEKLVYMDDLLKLKFSSVEAALSAQGSKIDAFMGKMDRLVEEAYRQQGDLRASAVGRSIDDRIKKLETTVVGEKRFDAMETRVGEVEKIADSHQARIDEQNGALWLVRGIATFAAVMAAAVAVLTAIHFL